MRPPSTLLGLWSRPWAPVAVAVLVSVALRAPFLTRLPYPDEGGLLLVAAHWHSGGPELYGSLFVDRPPLLLLFFLLAHALGGVLAARLLGLLMVAVLVSAAGRVGWLLAGRRGAAWAALVTSALAANPLLGTHEVNAELVGVPLVMVASALALDAVRRTDQARSRLLLVAAGLLAGSALLVKQNLLDGLVFAFVLIAVQARQSRWPMRRVAGSLAGLLLGATVPLVVTIVWVTTLGPGLDVAWASLVQFRVDAAEVLSATDSPANEHRLLDLINFGLLSGLVVLVVAALWEARSRRREAVAIALTATLVIEFAGVALGGSYWPHYLIALLPGVALLTAMSAGKDIRPAPMRTAVGLVVLVSVIAASLSLSHTVTGGPNNEKVLTSWLHAARRPGDTGAVTFGQADILEAASLRPGYHLLWSLPVRTLDPQLQEFTRLVRRPDGPVWIIESMPVDTWGLDDGDKAQRAIDQYFRLAATVCGTPVYLRRDQVRKLPPVPACD